jgi:hypothetical protein
VSLFAGDQSAGGIEEGDPELAGVAEVEADGRRRGGVVDLAGGDAEQDVDEGRAEGRRGRRGQHDGAGADDEHGAGDGDEVDPPDEPETHAGPPVASM